MSRHLRLMLLAVGLFGSCRSHETPMAHGEEISLNVTSWTERSELYMEYPPLVTGEKALFAVHLTTLADFRPMTAGQPSLEFVPEGGGRPTIVPGNPPSRPGVFRIEGVLPSAGSYRWTLVVNAPTLTDRHDLGRVTVFNDHQAAMAATPTMQTPEDPAAITYLKEQQWTNPFGTARAETRELRTAVRVPADLEPLTGGEALVSAPAAGRFVMDALPSVGDVVRAGSHLGRLEPKLSAGDDRASLQSSVTEAQAAVEAAHVEEARAQQLLTDRAIPARRLEDAKRARTVAEARLQAAQARLSQRDETLRSGGGAASGNAFALRAPISGRVAEVSATLGAAYEEGAPLFRIVRTDKLELRALVPAVDVVGARLASELAFEVPGRSEPIPLAFHHRHDAGILDRQTNALPLQFEVDNPKGELLVGQTGTALLYQREKTRATAVPKASVLTEAGRPYLFVHVSGERFARRIIEVSTRDGDWVGVKTGVSPGDRVVVQGAYDIQLASAAKGLPAEGHVH